MIPDPTVAEPSRTVPEPPSLRARYVLVILQGGGQLLSGFLVTLECAYFFGATRAKDAFDVAYLVPDVLLSVAGFSLMQSVATAMFARLRARGDADASEVFSTVVNLLLFTGAGTTLLGVVLARPLIRLIAPGLGATGIDIAVTQLLLLLPLTLCMGMSMFLGAVQTAYGYAGSNELGWLTLRVVVVLALLLVPRSLGVTGLSLCYAGGGVVALAVQVRLLRRTGLRYRATISLHSPYVRTMLRQAIGFGVSSILTQVAMLQARNLASRGPAGNIAALGYALSLSSLIYQLVAKPLMLVEGPHIIHQRETERRPAARRLQRVIIVALSLTVLFVLGILLTREPLVRLLFERGAFDAAATARTASFIGVLAFAALGDTMVAVTVLPALAQSEGMRVPLAFASSFAVQIVFMAVAFPWIGMGAVLWGFVLASAVRGMLVFLAGRRA